MHLGAKSAGLRGVAEPPLKLQRQFWWGGLMRAELRMRLAKAHYTRTLNAAEDCRTPKAKTLTKELNALWGSPRTFVKVKGVEAPNKGTEKAIRTAVLWHKGSFGTWHDRDIDMRFTERSLTITARKQGVALFSYLLAAVEARLNHLPTPALFKPQLAHMTS